MKVKRGVKLAGLQIEMRAVLIEAAKAYREEGYELVITSTTDGVHSPASYHPYGYAVDMRIKDIPLGNILAIREKLKSRLPTEYDVVLHESSHIHVEFDLRKAGRLGE